MGCCPFCGSDRIIEQPDDGTFLPRRGCLGCNRWLGGPRLKDDDTPGRQEIEALARTDPIVRVALDAHRLRGIPYVDALEAMVVTLAKKSQAQDEALLRLRELVPPGIVVLEEPEK